MTPPPPAGRRKRRERPDRAFWMVLATATVMGLGWLATLPAFPPPVAKPLPVLRVPRVNGVANGYFAWRTGVEGLRTTREDLKKPDLRKALMGGTPIRPLAGWLLPVSRSPLTKLRAARGYKAFQVLPPRAEGARLDGLQQLARLGDVATCVDFEQGRPAAALERSLDVLLLGHQLAQGRGEAGGAWLPGSVITIQHVQALLARPTLLARAPDAALQAYMAQLTRWAGDGPTLAQRVQLFQVYYSHMVQRRRTAMLLDDASGTAIFGPALMLFTLQTEGLYQTRLVELGGRHLAHLAVEAAHDRDFTALAARPDPCEAYYARIENGPTWPLTAVYHTGDYFAAIEMRDDRSFFEYAIDPLAARVYVEGLRVAVAATMYRRRHHRDAPTLSALTPWLGAVPRDPFRPSRPLGYGPHRVWSIGWDGQHQQGRPVPDMRPFSGAALSAKGDVLVTF